jgi:alkylated DNA nucleotide flippase Atl1
MTATHRRIFLSYRRDDCAFHADRLADDLRREAGDEVFLDTDTIKLGENFARRIEQEIARCDVVLVMIGDDWLTVSDTQGKLRIHDRLDWIYLEIKAALDRDVPVVPVLVEGASMPRPDQLPDELRELALRHGAELRDVSWRQDVLRLASALPAPVGSPTPVDPEAKRGPGTERVARARLDFVGAQAFVDAIPAGWWTSYKEVARAAGNANGAMAIGSWLLSGARTANAWRVLNSRGEVSEGWTPATDDQPRTTDDVRARLRAEGIDVDHRGRAEPGKRWTVEEARERDVFPQGQSGSPVSPKVVADTVIVAARKAYPDYLATNSYVCKPGRAFRSGIRFLGFYAEREIKPEVGRIRHRRDNVRFDHAQVSALRASDGEFDREVADLIELLLDPRVPLHVERVPGQAYQVFLLSHPNDDDTIRLKNVIRHTGRGAWTQSQRYVSSALLATSPDTTDDP